MYEPKPEHKFAFGLWTVDNPGADAFGQPVRPQRSPAAASNPHRGKSL